jgi:hypothetical protein
MAYDEVYAQRLRGIFFIILGLSLLLYVLGFIQRLGSTLLIVLSLFLIVSGFIEAGYQRYLTKAKIRLPE